MTNSMYVQTIAEREDGKAVAPVADGQKEKKKDYALKN